MIQEALLNVTESEYYYQRLLYEQAWPQNDYEVFGRRFSLPRQQTWHADSGIVYSYSDNLLQTLPWTPLLLSLREKIEAAAGLAFNAVLVNLYRNGEDYVGWHSDDERELGSNPVIASLSLGATRHFAYREISGIDTCLKQARQGSMALPPGSLLLMRPPFQQKWQHSVPPGDETQPRINLTFRYVYPPSGNN